MSYETTFTALRNMVGRPTLRCIQARANWTVTSGYSYDADYDRYVDSSGAVWEPVTANLPYDDIAILPSSGSALVELQAAGLIDAGDRVVRILPASKTTVEAAEFFTLDGFEYTLAECTPFPAGAALWYTVRLRKR